MAVDVGEEEGCLIGRPNADVMRISLAVLRIALSLITASKLRNFQLIFEIHSVYQIFLFKISANLDITQNLNN